MDQQRTTQLLKLGELCVDRDFKHDPMTRGWMLPHNLHPDQPHATYEAPRELASDLGAVQLST